MKQIKKPKNKKGLVARGMNYYFNLDKNHNKLEMASNWLTILLPLGLLTLMMIYIANTDGKTEQQILHSNGVGVIGLMFLLWIILFIWFVVYKIFKRVNKISKKSKKKKERLFNLKEDWEE